MQTFLRSEIDRCQRHNPVHTRHPSAALAEHDIESGEPQAAAGRLGATRGDSGRRSAHLQSHDSTQIG
jgi:hypothetical protein